METRGFLLLFVVLGAQGRTLSNFRCSRYCKEDRASTQYEVGYTYVYRYEGDLRTFVNATHPTNSVGVSFGSKIKITVLSPCDYVLTIEEFNSSDDSQQVFADQVKKYPVQFSYQSGRIGAVCPVDEENINVLNFKRAILSVFQNSNGNDKEVEVAYETDVSGNCETNYRVLNARPLRIEKRKNLASCAHRGNQHLSWNSVPYVNQSKKKSLPILVSKQTCEQTFDDDMVLLSSNCTERHGFQPFSNGNSGAVSFLTQSTTFVTKTRSLPITNPAKFSRRLTLIYEIETKSPGKVSQQTIFNTLKDLEQKMTNGIEQSAPSTFSILVRQLQSLSYVELLKIFENTMYNQTQRKSLLDAIMLLFTPDSVRTMKALYENFEINDSQVNSWIMMLASTRRPSLEMLNEMKGLVNMSENIRQTAVLTLSSLIHRFCETSSNYCTDIDDFVKDVVEAVEKPLKEGCVANSTKKRDDIVLALKGIGNMGTATSQELLKNCYAREDVPPEIRAVAIAAHRRIPCSKHNNIDDILSYFTNPNEDTEIRITAYLASMQCASYVTYTKVKEVLLKEELNQIGSFVWTHLTNLQESSLRWKQELRALVENDFLRNKFNTDVRKYSRNYELSTFFDAINVGAGVESNVIFTEESYLPRTAMLNLTLDLFGESVNVLEVGARLQGFEDVAEELFAPDGYFPEQSIKTLLENARAEHDIKSIRKLGDTFRAHKNLQKEAEGTMYMKLFGDELAYYRFRNPQPVPGKPVSFNSIQEAFMRFLKDNDFEFKRSFIFLDSSLTVPTLLGFPLELVANGTGSVALTTQGRIDLKDLKSFKMLISGKIYPNAVLEVKGTMMVDSIFTKTGLKTINTMNSNSYMDGHVQMDGSRLVDVKVNFPKDQINILHIESQVFTVDGSISKEIKNTSNNVEEWKACTPKMLGRLTGLEVCYDVRYVNATTFNNDPYFPLTGSFKYSVNLKKIDTFDSYQLYINSTSTDASIYSLSLYFDTPNSAVNRKVAASYQVDTQRLLAHFFFYCPIGNLEIHGNLGNRDRRNIQLQALFKNKELFSFQSSLTSKIQGSSWEYAPSAKVRYKLKEVAQLSGNIQYMEGTSYSAHLKLEGMTADPILISGSFNHSNKKYEAAVSIKSKLLKGDLRTDFMKTSNSFAFKMFSVYNVDNGNNQTVRTSVKGGRFSNEVNFYLAHKSTEFPSYDIEIAAESVRKGLLYLENGIKVTVFDTSWTGHQLFKYKRPNNYYDFAFSCSLTCKEKGIDYAADLSHNSSDVTFNVHALLKLNDIQRLEGLIKYDGSNVVVKHLEAWIYFPQQTWSIEGKLEEKNSGKYSGEISGGVTIASGRKQRLISMTGDYVNASTNLMQSHVASAKVSFPGLRRSPCLIDVSLQKSRDLFYATLELKMDLDIYSSHVTWTDAGFTALVQKNRKKLFLVSGARTKSEISGVVVLNVYQHFEMTTKLVMPFQKFEFAFYWDKDRDPEKKVALALNGDNLGLYELELQYPNQRILASFLLIPNQVTLNVTWGTDLTQRIYLEAGNKIYDVGGVWFGKLQTPFSYLENQEFQLHYYFIADKVEIKADVNWRDQNINAVMSGDRSCCHVYGSFKLETTLSDLRILMASFRHSKEANIITTNGDFVFNDQQILLETKLQYEGLNVNSGFSVTSPSNSIRPIIGKFDLHNNSTTKNLNFSITWEEKTISLVYKFANSHSYVKIVTPFECLKETQFDYTLYADVDNLVLEIRVDLFEQLNYGLLSWNNAHEAITVKLEVLSSLIGTYKVLFKHSTVFGQLQELLVVTQGKEGKEILSLKLIGELVPISSANIQGEAILLGYNASIKVTNSPSPLLSVARIQLNDDYILSKLEAHTDDDRIKSFTIQVTSSILNDPIEFGYYNVWGDRPSIHLFLPKGYKFTNILFVKNGFASIQNVLNVDTPHKSGRLKYFHDFDSKGFKHVILLKFGEDECSYNFHYNLNEYVNFIVDSAEMRLRSPWYSDVVVRFTMPTENFSLWKPSLYIIYDEMNPIKITSSVKYEPFSSFVVLSIQISERSVLDVEFSYDFEKHTNKIRMKLKRPGSAHAVSADVRLDLEDGLVSVRASNASQDLIVVYGECRLTEVSRSLRGDFNVSLQNFFIQANAMASLVDETLDLTAALDSNVPDFENAFLHLVVALNMDSQRGNLRLGYGGKTADVDYRLESGNGNLVLFNASLVSNFTAVKNVSVDLKSIISPKDSQFRLRSSFNKREALIDFVYKFNNFMKGESLLSNLDGNLFLGYNSPYRQLFNISAAVSGSVENDGSGTKVNSKFISNIPKLKSMQARAVYRRIIDGYEFDFDMIHENYTYTLKHNLSHSSDKTLTAHVEVITSSFGNVFGFLDVAESKINATAKYQKDSIVYKADALSFYEKLRSSTNFDISTPKSKYVGVLEFDLFNNAKHLNFTVKHPDNSREKLNVVVVYDTWKNVTITLLVNPQYSIDLRHRFLTLTNMKTSLRYKLGEKFLADFNVDQKDIFLKVDTPTKTNYLFLNGTHEFKDKPKSFSANYNLLLNATVVHFEASGSVKAQEFRAKVNLQSNLFDDIQAHLSAAEVIDGGISYGKHDFKLMINKFAFFLNQPVVLMTYDETPLLKLWSERSRFHVTSVSDLGKYSMSVDHDFETPSLGIKITNNSTDLLLISVKSQVKQNDFQGNSEVKILLGGSVLNLIINMRQYPGFRSIESSFSNNARVIFYASARLEMNNDTYNAAVTTKTPLKALQLLDSVVYIDVRDYTFNSKVAITRYQKTYSGYLVFQLPKNGNSVKFDLKYPYKDEYCQLYLQFEPVYANVYVISPFHEFRNLSMALAFNKEVNRYNGGVYLRKNDNFANTLWNFGYNGGNSAVAEVEITNNVLQVLQNISMGLSYTFYEKLDMNVRLQDQYNKATVTYDDSDGKSLLLKGSLPSFLLPDVSADGSLLWNDTKRVAFSWSTRNSANNFSLEIEPSSGIRIFAQLQDWGSGIEICSRYKEYSGEFLVKINDDTLFMLTLQNVTKLVQFRLNLLEQLDLYVTQTSNGFNINQIILQRLGLMAKGHVSWSKGGITVTKPENSNDVQHSLIWSLQDKYDLHFMTNGSQYVAKVACYNFDGKIQSVINISFPEATFTLNFDNIQNKNSSILATHLSVTKGNRSWFVKSNLTREIHKTHSAIVFLMNSTFIGDLEANVKYSINDLTRKRTCSTCPEPYLVASVRSPFRGYKTASIKIHFNRDSSLLTLRLASENMNYRLEGTLHPKGNNLYTAEVRDSKQGKTLAYASWTSDSSKKSPMITFSFHVLTPFENLRNLHLTGDILEEANSTKFQTQAAWNEDNMTITGRLLYDAKNADLQCQVNYKNQEGHFTLKNAKKWSWWRTEVSGAFPSKNPKFDLYFLAEKFNGTVSVLRLKSPFDHIKEISFESGYSASDMSMDLKGTMRNTSFAASGKIRVLDRGGCDGKVFIDVSENELFLEGLATVEKGYVILGSKEMGDFKNITSGYDFLNNPNETVFSSYLVVDKRILNIDNITLGLTYKRGIETYYEFYNNKNNISLKLVDTRDGVEIDGLVELPFLEMKRASLSMARNNVLGTVSCKYAYDTNYFDLQYRDNIALVLEYQVTSFAELSDLFVFNFAHVEVQLVNQQSLTIKFCDKTDSCTQTTASFTNDAEKFEIVLVCEEPVGTYGLRISKNLIGVYLQLSNFLLVDVNHPNPSMADLHLVFAQGFSRHELLIKFDGMYMAMSINSPLLEEESLGVVFNYTRNDGLISIDLRMVKTEESILQFGFVLEPSDSNTNALLDIRYRDQKVFVIDAKIVITDITETFLTWFLFGDKSTGYLMLNTKSPYAVGFTVDTPFLSHNGFTFEVVAYKMMKFFLFAGNGPSEILQNGLLSPEAHNGYLLLEGILEKNFYKAKLEASQINDVHAVRAEIKLDKGETVTNFTTSLYLNWHRNMSSEILYEKTDARATFRGNLVLPGLDRLALRATVPLKLKDAKKLELFASLFDKIYEIHASRDNAAESVAIVAGYRWNQLSCSAVIRVMQSPELFLDIQLHYNRFTLVLNRNSLYSDRSTSYVELNGKRYLLEHAVALQKDLKLLNLVLLTPYHDQHKNYSLLFEYANGDRNVFKVYVNHPLFDREMGFEFHVQYEGLNSFKAKSQMRLPITNFQKAHVNIMHEFSDIRQSKTYVLDVGGGLNEHNVFLNVEAANIVNFKKFNVLAGLNELKYHASFEAVGKALNDGSFEFTLDTPLKVVENVHVNLNSSVDNFKRARIIYNNQSVLYADLQILDNVYAIALDSIWKHAGAEYKYISEEIIDASCRIYWDRDESSQIGGKLLIGEDFLFNVTLPTRTVGTELKYFTNSTTEIYKAKAYWNKDDSVFANLIFGNQEFHDRSQVSYVVSLGTPFKSIEIGHDLTARLQDTIYILSNIRFKWDEDNTSYFALNTELATGKLRIQLSSPRLDSDLALDIALATAIGNGPSYLRVIIEYSKLLEKRAEFEIFYNKLLTNVFTSERIITIKHPASKIDYVLRFAALRTKKFTNGSVSLKYKNYFTGNREKIEGFIKVAHEKFDVSGKIKTDANSLSLGTYSESDLDHHAFTVYLQTDDKDPLIVKCSCKFKQRIPSLTISTMYGDSRKYDLYLGMPTKKQVLVKVLHNLYNEEFVDAIFTARLNSSQLLWLKLQWQKNILLNFYRATLDEYSDLKFVVEAIGKDLIDSVHDDFGKQLALDVSEMKENFTGFVKHELTALNKSYGDFIKASHEGYENNAFFCNSILHVLKAISDHFGLSSQIIQPLVDSVKFAYDSVLFIIDDISSCARYINSTIQIHVESILRDIKNVVNLKQRAKEMLKTGIEDARRCLQKLHVATIKTLDMLEGYVNETKKKIEKFFEPCLNILDDTIAYLEQRLAVLQIIVLDTQDLVQRYVMRVQEIKELMDIYTSYLQWIEHLHVSDILEPVTKIIEAVADKIVADLKRIVDDYRLYIDAILDLIFGNYEELGTLPPLKEVKEFLNKVYQKTVWFWNYHKLSETLKNQISELISTADEVLIFVMEIDNISNDDFETVLSDISYTYKPDLGHIEVSLPLAVEWEAFDQLPTFEQHSLYQKIQKWIKHFYQLQAYPRELFNCLRNSLGITFNETSPYTDNVGMIIGKSHYITYNDLHFSFVGECSYLLASNFKSNSFSLIANYETKDGVALKRSLTIIIPIGEIEITTDHQVYFNKKRMDLPIVMNVTTITRNYQQLMVETPFGLSVTCNLVYDICAVKLTPWMFGNTGGLLGTIDNEKATDLTLPNGTRAADVFQFTQSWKLGNPSCRDVDHTNETLTPVVTPLDEKLTDELCSVLFAQYHGPLTQCYSRIDPQPYKEMCKVDMSDVSNPTVCSSVAAYIERCKSASVKMEMPKICVNCKAGNVTIGTEEEIFDGHNPSSLDVVFVMDNECFTNKLLKIPKELDRTLQLRGFTENRFAYVGYGLKALKNPYSRTFNQSLWIDSENLDLTIKKEFGEAGGTVTAVDAVQYASQLDFRPRVSRILILLQCQSCPRLDNIADVYNKLSNKDIILHVINSRPEFGDNYFSLDANSNTMFKKINTTAIEIESLDNNTNDEMLEDISDTCSLLALGTNGTISRLDGFENYSNFTKNWASFATKTVKRSPCQKCRCTADEFGIGQIECTRCLAPALKYLLNEYESNIIDYHQGANDNEE